MRKNFRRRVRNVLNLTNLLVHVSIWDNSVTFSSPLDNRTMLAETDFPGTLSPVITRSPLRGGLSTREILYIQFHSKIFRRLNRSRRLPADDSGTPSSPSEFFFAEGDVQSRSQSEAGAWRLAALLGWPAIAQI
jgi:hypothetical protein